MRWVAAIVALAVMLAGCSGGGKRAADADFSDLDLDATADTGVIRGVVVDLAIIPVPGATVQVKGSDKVATTGEDGLFGFEGLAPGLYFLDVSAPGHHSVQQSAEVVAGESEPPIVKVALQRAVTIDPFVEQHLYRGYISCSFKVANRVFRAEDCDPTGHLGFAADDDAAPWFAVTSEPAYYQSEIKWESTQPAGDELVTIQIACSEPEAGGCSEVADEEEDDYNRLCNVRGTSPLVCRVNATTGGGGGGVGIQDAQFGGNRTGYSVGVYANCDPCIPTTILGFGLVLEQRFEVYNHVFHGYSPPADWLFTETSTVPQPPPS